MEQISVYTAGYEDRNITEFIDGLRRNNINVLIDIRAVPASRKAGFSKNKLKEHLEAVNIKYMHVGELGSPKELRNELHDDNDYDRFFKKYRDYLSSQMDTLVRLYEDVIANESSCLMCMERKPEHCHRIIVAEKIKDIDGNGLIIIHI